MLWRGTTGCQRFDNAICSGVMEYVEDPSEMIRTVMKWAQRLILSYAVREATPEIELRGAQGWVNDLAYVELPALLSEQRIHARQRGVWRGQVTLDGADLERALDSAAVELGRARTRG